MSIDEPRGPRKSRLVAFRRGVVSWGRAGHLRKLPWRTGVPAPFHILLAEVLLRRTTVGQVAAVYPHLVRRYPTPLALGAADPADMLRLLSPLGLRSRAAELVELGAEVARRGNVPTERDELLGLPGVGPYTAAAVRCFAWSEAEPLLDTNTVRIVGRYFGIPFDEGSHRDLRFRELLGRLVPRKAPILFNQSLLDLGALICKAGEPSCKSCPLRRGCAFAQRGGS